MQEINQTREDEIFNAIHRREFISWDNWLNQKLGSLSEPDKRYERFADITTTIFNNFKDTGYYLLLDKSTLFNKILVWAYTIDKQFYLYSSPDLTMDSPTHRDYQKDRDNYDRAFDIANYWTLIRSWADSMLFATLNASSYFWANLPFFIYRFIDIAHSPYINKYDEEEKKVEDEEIESLIEQGILFVDKRGRLISAALRDTYDE